MNDKLELELDEHRDHKRKSMLAAMFKELERKRVERQQEKVKARRERWRKLVARDKDKLKPFKRLPVKQRLTYKSAMDKAYYVLRLTDEGSKAYAAMTPEQRRAAKEELAKQWL